VRAILFRIRAGKVFAQVEPFFFARRPLPLTEELIGHVTLPVQWPQIPVEELGTYGVFEPGGKYRAEPDAAADGGRDSGSS
jgi:hypothetical protein